MASELWGQGVHSTQHLKDLIQCRESGSDFLTALTGFTNLVLAGWCPVDVIPTFFGGRLIALNKKSGGIRPIASHSGVWYLNVPIRMLLPVCPLSSVQSSWEWARQEAVRRRSMQRVGFWKLCLMTTWSSSWTFPMLSTAFADQTCSSQLQTESLSCFLTAIQLMQIRQYCITVITLLCH